MPEQQLVDKLASAPRGQFQSIVVAELRSRFAEEDLIFLHGFLPLAPIDIDDDDLRFEVVYDALMHHRLVERWLVQLVDRKKSVEFQLAARKAEYRIGIEPEEGFLTWRAATLRFLAAIEERITVAREISNRHLMSERGHAMQKERDRLGHQVDLLRKAIARHKKSSERQRRAASDADTELWKWMRDD